MCKQCVANPYVTPSPKDYNPNINQEVLNKRSDKYDQNIAHAITDLYKTAFTFWKKESYYVGADNQLHGYRWINFPMRAINPICNLFSNDEQKVVGKLIGLFSFILNINTSHLIPAHAENDQGFGNTSFSRDIKFYTSYTDLAEKVISKFSKDKYPELFNLAHRILHERPGYIPVKEEGSEAIKMKKNISRFAHGTAWTATTVWDED